MLDGKADRKARMHGLWALIGSGPLEPGFHAKLLAHPDPTYRAWGVRAAGNMGQVEPSIREQVIGLAHDPSPDVRLQVAIAAKKLRGHDRMPTLLDVQAESYRDPLIPQIVWQNLHPLLDDRPDEFARWLERYRTNRPADRPRAPDFEGVLSGLMPHLVDKLLTRPGADGKSAARVLLAELCGTNRRSARPCDVVASRLREHSLPEDVDRSLRRTLKEQLGSPLRRMAAFFPPEYGILLAYAGDAEGIGLRDLRPIQAGRRSAAAGDRGHLRSSSRRRPSIRFSSRYCPGIATRPRTNSGARSSTRSANWTTRRSRRSSSRHFRNCRHRSSPGPSSC